MVNKSHSNYLHKPLIQSKKVRTMSPDFFIIRKQLDRNLSHEKHCKKIVLKSRMRSIAKKIIVLKSRMRSTKIMQILSHNLHLQKVDLYGITYY